MRKALAVTLAFSLSFTPLVMAAPRAALQEDDDESSDEGAESFSPEQLDNLLAPIALYPDPLLAQVLLAATFVDQVDEAGRYVRANGQNGIDDEDWDVSVKAVAHYPVVLDYLADKLDWTATLGQAYASQSTDVMISVQRLRRMARSQGNLETTPEQEVVLDDDYIQIVPAQPSFIYVPRYSPAFVYYHRPLSGFAITFGVGLAIGAWLNDDFDWRGHRVFYHGWSGGGWIARSRPRVVVNRIYVNTRYSDVRFNRRVVDRRVNYGTLNRYNSIHRNVTYDNVRVHRGVRIEERPAERPRPANAIIDRNINTRDPHLDRYRGRDEQRRSGDNPRVAPEPRPAPAAPPPAATPRGDRRDRRPDRRSDPAGGATAGPATAPVVAPRPDPTPRPAPHAYGGRSESGFDPGASSRRGHDSREAAKAPPPPPRPAHAARPAAEKAQPRREQQQERKEQDNKKKK